MRSNSSIFNAVGVGLRRLTVVIAAAALGCGKPTPASSGPALFPVHGEIRIDGAVPVGATIRFISPQSSVWGRTPMALVHEDGSFSASFAAKEDGMPAGDYDVLVYWLEPPPEGGLPVDRLQGRFCDLQNPAVRANVREGENQLPRWELSTKH